MNRVMKDRAKAKCIVCTLCSGQKRCAWIPTERLRDVTQIQLRGQKPLGSQWSVFLQGSKQGLELVS